jgi:hypothetical protein
MSEDEQKKKFALMIADVIQQLLRNSDELADVLGQAHDEGYDIFLSIFSGIVIRRQGETHSEERRRIIEKESLPSKFEFTESDKEFLKSIGIEAPEW